MAVRCPRLRILIPPCGGSNPPALASFNICRQVAGGLHIALDVIEREDILEDFPCIVPQ